MKKNYPLNAITLLLKSCFLFFFFFAILTAQAQTSCTSNDPTICNLAVVDPNASFTAESGTNLATNGTVFILSGSVSSTLSITSGVYQVTTPGCVIARFDVVTTGTISNTSTITVTTSTGQTLTCNIAQINNGSACIKICDPILTQGSLVTFRLNFNGNLNSQTVTVSAFSTLNVATAANINCPTSFICLDNTASCTTPCDPNFTNLSGKIRVFFPTPIPIGTPTPMVNDAATSVLGVTTPLTQFKFCLNADAGTTVARTFADYCVYSNIANQILPTTNLVLTLQSFSLPPISCAVNLETLICPTGFTNITDSRTCVNCDPNNFPFSAGKIRIFFPTAIPRGLPNPVINAIAGTGITAGSLKLCALTDGGTNVARTYADYCVFSSIQNFTISLLNPLTFTTQLSSCSQSQVCVLDPVTLPPCQQSTFVVIDDGNGGGTGGGLGTCASTSTCAGTTVYLASRLRVNFSPCLPANVPAPNITSIQTVNADGTISLLNNDYCINVSDESAAQIGNSRCFIEYCVYSKVNGNTFFVSPPATMQFNQESTATLGGQQTPVTTSCSTARQAAPLPVTLLNFNYQVQNCGVNLEFATAQEANSKEFVIQNSTNGTSWKSIGSVTAKGNSSSLSNYSFVHPNPVNGKNYYRLIAVDRDGMSKYSDILTTTINCVKNDIFVHPNPFVNSINIDFTATRNGLAKISIHDNAGRLMMQMNKSVLSGSNTIHLNGLERLLKGVYILTVKTDDAEINQKLLK